MLGEHTKVALHFSGGKDSLACLHMLRPWWDRVMVMWCNTGDAFPETIMQMEDVRARVPYFMEVPGNQPAQIKVSGMPADVISVWDSPFGHAVYHGRTNRTQPAYICCGANIWSPLRVATKEYGATLIVRGQRDAEKLRSPIKSGHVEDGVEYLFPIEGWTDEQVFQYLNDNDIPIPKHYKFVNTSLDCKHCTAYLFENAGKFRYMKQEHPELYESMRFRLKYVAEAARSELKHIDDILAERHDG